MLTDQELESLEQLGRAMDEVQPASRGHFAEFTMRAAAELRELRAIAVILSQAMPSFAYDLRERMAEYEHMTTPKTTFFMTKLDELLAAHFAAHFAALASKESK